MKPPPKVGEIDTWNPKAYGLNSYLAGTPTISQFSYSLKELLPQSLKFKNIL